MPSPRPKGKSTTRSRRFNPSFPAYDCVHARFVLDCSSSVIRFELVSMLISTIGAISSQPQIWLGYVKPPSTSRMLIVHLFSEDGLASADRYQDAHKPLQSSQSPFLSPSSQGLHRLKLILTGPCNSVQRASELIPSHGTQLLAWT